MLWRLTLERKIWNFALVIILSPLPIEYPSLVSLSNSRHFINEALCKLFDLVSCSLQYHFHLNPVSFSLNLSGVFLNALLSYTGFHKIHRHTFVVHYQKCLWFADCGHLVPVLSHQIFQNLLYHRKLNSHYIEIIFIHNRPTFHLALRLLISVYLILWNMLPLNEMNKLSYEMDVTLQIFSIVHIYHI